MWVHPALPPTPAPDPICHCSTLAPAHPSLPRHSGPRRPRRCLSEATNKSGPPSVSGHLGDVFLLLPCSRQASFSQSLRCCASSTPHPLHEPVSPDKPAPHPSEPCPSITPPEGQDQILDFHLPSVLLPQREQSLLFLGLHLPVGCSD